MLMLMVLPIVAWQDIPVDGHAVAEAGRPLAEVRATLGVTPYLAMVSPALAVFAVVLSIVKPWGLTPLGHRQFGVELADDVFQHRGGCPFPTAAVDGKPLPGTHCA